MCTLELRRHSIRARPGQHLTQAGVTLARRVGETIGPFDRVITSAVPRACETALAMGFAVDEQLDILGEMDSEVSAEIAWPASFGEIAAALRHGEAAARFARKLAKALREIARSLPEDGAALVISHGGIVEAAAIGCVPDANHGAWGGYCDYCEGVRLAFDGKRFISAKILRVSQT